LRLIYTQVIASAILNEKYPREDNYWVLLGIIVVNIFVAIFLLKESKPKAKDEEDQITGKVRLPLCLRGVPGSFFPSSQDRVL
jgi:hypothetical protein